MNISKQCIGFDLTPSLEDAINQRLSNAVAHFDKATSVRAVLSKPRRDITKADLTAHLPGHKLHAEAQGPDMYQVIDLAAQRLSHQIDKIKDRASTHNQTSPKRMNAAAESETEETERHSERETG